MQVLSIYVDELSLALGYQFSLLLQCIIIPTQGKTIRIEEVCVDDFCRADNWMVNSINGTKLRSESERCTHSARYAPSSGA